LTEYSLAKNEVKLDAGLRSLEIARSAGVKIGFGSDLLGQLQDDQSKEFLIRREALPAAEIIRSATIINAEIVQKPGELGELIPGAYADLLVVDGNPYEDFGLFQDAGAHLSAIMKGGRFYKNQLN
ncbi:MAG: amidohydrolase family protein, partial [Rhizobiales bacterium]|nr:amidohydrolase family protein [Hyphomicrobiales bacterium]